MAATDFLEDKFRRHLFGTASYAKPTQLWIGLYTAEPTEAGGGTEVSAPSYAAQRLDPTDANWAFPDASGGEANNIAVITFPDPQESWGVVTHVAIKDESNNKLIWGPLGSPKTINAQDAAPRFSIGTLKAIFR